MSANYVVNRNGKGYPVPVRNFGYGVGFYECPIVGFHLLANFNEAIPEYKPSPREYHINVCVAPDDFIKAYKEDNDNVHYSPCELAILNKLANNHGNVIQLNSRRLATKADRTVMVNDVPVHVTYTGDRFSLRTVQKAIKGLIDKDIIVKFNVSLDHGFAYDAVYKDLYVINYSKVRVTPKYYEAFKNMYDLVHFNKKIRVDDKGVHYSYDYEKYNEVFSIKAKDIDLGSYVPNCRLVVEENHILLAPNAPKKPTGKTYVDKGGTFGYHGDTKPNWFWNRIKYLLSLFKFK